MNKPTIGLCMIVKDEELNIRRAIESIIDQVDVVYLTDTGSTDDTIKIAKKTCKAYNKPIEVSHFEWCDDYSKARQFNFDQAKTDWILWIDADDTVEGAENLPKVVQIAEQSRRTGIAFVYRYYVSEKGDDIDKHNKLRLVRNGVYEWTPKAPIHENLFIKDGFTANEALDRAIKVRHWATPEDFKKSGKRNLRILRALEEREGDNPDPRTIFLLGRELHAQEQYKEAIPYLKKYLELVYEGGERVAVCKMLTDIYMRDGDYKNEGKYAFEAVKSYPNYPTGYILVARYYSHLGDYSEVINWAKLSLSKEMDDLDATVHSPMWLEQQASMLLVEAYTKLKQYKIALGVLENYFKKASKEEQEMLAKEANKIQSLQNADDILNAFTGLANAAIMQDKLEQLRSIIETIPEPLKNKKQVLRLKRKFGMNEVWDKDTITIYCGYSAEEWDDESLKRGIGGSETAVIEMARRWGEAGYKVTVYNSSSETKQFSNVTYKDAKEINWEDHFNILISWRNPFVFEEVEVLANKKYLWLHDVPQPAVFTKQVTDNIDKIIVLSNYHRSLLPFIPDNKFYISRNGIDTKLIKKIGKEGIKRNPKQVIYASSPDRGLDKLLIAWKDVKDQVPDAELVVAYGWDNFDKLRPDRASREWKAAMCKVMDDLGVRQVGRLGKEDLYREFFKSSIWAYPTDFQEISCITAMEAQACGCYPITSGFAALEETQKWGEYIPNEIINYGKYGVMIADGWSFANPQTMDGHFQFKNQIEGFMTRLVDHLQENEYATRVDAPKSISSIFSWDGVAKEWMNDLFFGVEPELELPLVSVICTTIRPGIFRVLKEQIEKQTYPSIELVVVDGRYEERKTEINNYFKGFKYPVLHLPDPQRDKNKYPYGLCHAHNAALSVANGELLVFLQDFIEIPKDGIEKYVKLYRQHPDKIYTGVDKRFGFKSDKVDIKDPIDVFGGGKFELAEEQFVSPRIRIKGAKRMSVNPFEWELNWAAAPKKILEDLGGWNNDWDRAFGYDNTELALRFIYENGIIIVDETNIANAISHWDMSEGDKFGVPERSKKTNDKRYATYMNYLSTSDNADVRLKFENPKYEKKIQNIIDRFRANS